MLMLSQQCYFNKKISLFFFLKKDNRSLHEMNLPCHKHEHAPSAIFPYSILSVVCWTNEGVFSLACYLISIFRLNPVATPSVLHDKLTWTCVFCRGQCRKQLSQAFQRRQSWDQCGPRLLLYPIIIQPKQKQTWCAVTNSVSADIPSQVVKQLKIQNRVSECEKSLIYIIFFYCLRDN